jgi:hypothetical protein
VLNRRPLVLNFTMAPREDNKASDVDNATDTNPRPEDPKPHWTARAALNAISKANRERRKLQKGDKNANSDAGHSAPGENNSD